VSGAYGINLSSYFSLVKLSRLPALDEPVSADNYAG